MTDEVEIVQGTKPDNRITNNDYYHVFQTEGSTGKLIFDQLYTRHVLNKTFDPDPYVHAYNAGKAAVIQEIANRCRPEAEVEASTEPKISKWTIEGRPKV